jgi:hypothetical protein
LSQLALVVVQLATDLILHSVAWLQSVAGMEQTANRKLRELEDLVVVRQVVREWPVRELLIKVTTVVEVARVQTLQLLGQPVGAVALVK